MLSAFTQAFRTPDLRAKLLFTLGIIAGLFLGKPIGITATTFLLSRLPAFQLDDSLRWPDIIGMGFVAGVGFTVSLLVGELAYGAASVADEHVK